MERRKKVQRKGQRRQLLTEKEFRTLIETDKVGKSDRRSWKERRKKRKRRKVIVGL